MAEKILIIEDEKILSEMYEERLEKEGFNVFSSTSAKGGIEMAKKEKPDLILLDIILPDADMDGVDALKTFKEDKDTKNIPILLFSNYDTPEVRQTAKQYNTKYILKASTSTKDLIDKIKGEVKGESKKEQK